MILPDIMLVYGPLAVDDQRHQRQDVHRRARATNCNCGAISKWELMVPALNQVITGTDAKVNWGMFYLGRRAGAVLGGDRAGRPDRRD